MQTHACCQLEGVHQILHPSVILSQKSHKIRLFLFLSVSSPSPTPLNKDTTATWQVATAIQQPGKGHESREVSKTALSCQRVEAVRLLRSASSFD